MMIFKTSEQCVVELIACTQMANQTNGTGDMDRFPARAARVSLANDKEERGEDADKKLIGYLAANKHLTPFEYQHATVMIECPLFVRSQIHRHRTFSLNEISRRYTSDDLGFWIPSVWRGQGKTNRQASEGELDPTLNAQTLGDYKVQCAYCLNAYNRFIEDGVAREQARSVLPQSLLTRFYMGGNLRNWAHFLELRLDAHAQPEIQVVARKIEAIIHDLWPSSLDALMNKGK